MAIYKSMGALIAGQKYREHAGEIPMVEEEEKNSEYIGIHIVLQRAEPRGSRNTRV